jgi:hypothetical protein
MSFAKDETTSRRDVQLDVKDTARGLNNGHGRVVSYQSVHVSRGILEVCPNGQADVLRTESVKTEA